MKDLFMEGYKAGSGELDKRIDKFEKSLKKRVYCSNEGEQSLFHHG